MDVSVQGPEPAREDLEALLERDWLSAKQAARELDRTPQMVWTMGRSGRLRVLHIPGGILYRRADVARVLTEREGARR